MRLNITRVIGLVRVSIQITVCEVSTTVTARVPYHISSVLIYHSFSHRKRSLFDCKC